MRDLRPPNPVPMPCRIGLHAYCGEWVPSGRKAVCCWRCGAERVEPRLLASAPGSAPTDRDVALMLLRAQY